MGNFGPKNFFCRKTGNTPKYFFKVKKISFWTVYRWKSGVYRGFFSMNVKLLLIGNFWPKTIFVTKSEVPWNNFSKSKNGKKSVLGPFIVEKDAFIVAFFHECQAYIHRQLLTKNYFGHKTGSTLNNFWNSKNCKKNHFF